MIRHAAPARVGILGNPSDDYGGRTLALAVPHLEATVTLEPADGIEIVPNPDDEPRWDSLTALRARADHYGYGTGPQLLTATIRTFLAVAESLEHGVTRAPGFRLSYETTIPRQVGLGGSSALVISTLRCLEEHLGLEIPEHVLPSIALRVETAQLGLAAGLQDRVIQCYGGLVSMDFSDLTVDSRFGVSYGTYERVDSAALPPLFVAYRETSAQPSDDVHHRLRHRFEQGDGLVRETLRELAGLVVEGRAALRWGDGQTFAALIGRNMTVRRALGPLPAEHLELVDVAEACGATATFAGSGGAVVGPFDDEVQFERLCDAYADIGANAIRIENEPNELAEEPTGEGEATNVVSLGRHSR